MKYETAWRAEWAVLHAEGDAARRRWTGARDALAARARDPLGLDRLVRDHPVAAGVAGAAAAALLGKLLGGRAAPAREGPSHDGAAASPAPRLGSLLRDVALSVAVPWVLRKIEDHVRGETGAVAGRDAARDPRTTAAPAGSPEPAA